MKRVKILIFISILLLSVSIINVKVSAITKDNTKKIDSSHLIVPGVSLGKIKLNMKIKQVTKILGKPSQKNSDSIIYYSKDKKNYIEIFIKKNKVSEIIFTSSKFETADGDRIDPDNNIELDIDKFNAWKFQWRMIQTRYTWKKGGLTFYCFNADAVEDNPEYTRNCIGILHKGKNPKYVPIDGAEWKKWDGKDLYN